MESRSKIILIYGPTASGKSEFAIKKKKKIGGEIVNADSMQVYKELKIISARPHKNEYKKIKHHLYGFWSVKKKFSTGDWLRLVKLKITDIKKRKKIPILVGGTGLYFKALTDGLVKIPNIPLKLRKKVRNLHKDLGPKKFFLRLKKLDPISINFINPLDSQRVIRAYEIKLYTKKSMYEWFKNTKSDFEKGDFFRIYIDCSRENLIKRINVRAKNMIENGAILEIKKFIKLKVSKSKTASKAIGVREIQDFLNKNIDKSELTQKISIKTRQYAKRQTTWARGHMLNWNRIKSERLNNFLKKI